MEQKIIESLLKTKNYLKKEKTLSNIEGIFTLERNKFFFDFVYYPGINNTIPLKEYMGKTTVLFSVNYNFFVKDELVNSELVNSFDDFASDIHEIDTPIIVYPLFHENKFDSFINYARIKKRKELNTELDITRNILVDYLFLNSLDWSVVNKLQHYFIDYKNTGKIQEILDKIGIPACLELLIDYWKIKEKRTLILSDVYGPYRKNISKELNPIDTNFVFSG